MAEIVSGIRSGETLQSLQILRFFSAASVVVFHALYPVGVGEFGVDVFFVISGFVVGLVIADGRSAFSFMAGRLVRVFPLYFLATTVLTVAMFLEPEYINPKLILSTNVETYLKSIFFIPYYAGGKIQPILYPGWSLNYEIVFYIIAAFSILFSGKHPRFFLIVLTSAAYVCFNLSPGGLIKSFYGNQIFLEFVFGLIACCFYSAGLLKALRPAACAIGAAASFLFMIYAETSGGSYGRIWMFGAPSFILVVCAVALERQIGKNKNIIFATLRRMGDASYAVYLTHWFVIVFVKKILDGALNVVDYYTLNGFLLAVFLSLAVGQAVHQFIDDPLRRYLTRFCSPGRLGGGASAPTAAPRKA